MTEIIIIRLLEAQNNNIINFAYLLSLTEINLGFKVKYFICDLISFQLIINSNFNLILEDIY